MARLAIAAAAVATVFATGALAGSKPTWSDGANLAYMNLTPTKAVERKIAMRDFTPDKTPTSFNYALPEPGMGAVLGYKPYVDTHPIQGYEVNEATAIGFNQPSSSVGAALAYKF